jgi:hypothetical protein
MGVILNFNNWSKLNEEATPPVDGQTPADLKALDTIQLIADKGPYMEFGGMSGAAASEMQAVKAAGGETLITALAGTLSTGRVTKTISFIAAMDPTNASSKKWKIKAEFFGKGGVLNAIVYKDGAQVLNGPVTIKDHNGWKQLMSIGGNTNMTLVDESGSETEYKGWPAPIAAGITNIVWNLGGASDNTNTPTATNVPRGGSNVKASDKNAELISYVNKQRSERAAATPPTKS